MGKINKFKNVMNLEYLLNIDIWKLDNRNTERNFEYKSMNELRANNSE